jgi:hypothetical protein
LGAYFQRALFSLEYAAIKKTMFGINVFIFNIYKVQQDTKGF